MSSTRTGSPRCSIACRGATDLSSTTTPHDGSRPTVTSPDSGSWWVENPPSLATNSPSLLGGAGGLLPSISPTNPLSETGQPLGRRLRRAKARHPRLAPALDVDQRPAGDVPVPHLRGID